jgi:hypothetical protein
VSTGPVFDDPAYEDLYRIAPHLLLPGIEGLEPDGVALLQITPQAIEAFLAGLNHELRRELLWREFPAELSGTGFRRFWATGAPEIPPIDQWGDTALGSHLRAADGQLVLVMRGELLRRYPTTTVYAAQANASGTLDPSTRLAPMFRGSLAPDLTLLGFALSAEAALGQEPAGPGWYFVFEEHPGRPRFGFDEMAGPGVPKTADALAWAHIPVTASGHADVAHPLLSADPALQARWGLESARTASLTFQQPFRVGLHASRLLPGASR